MKILVQGVTFRYPPDVLALADVSLTIEPGESVAIVGENGAGKTTLARHLNGLLHPRAGAVHIGGWDARGKTVAQLSSRVGYVFQNPDDQLFARTVHEEVAFGPRNLGWDPEEVAESVEDALGLVGLLEAAERHPYDLPATERKMLALAATLAMRTPIVILDEPTTGQDASGIRRLAAIIEWLKRAGRTVITITHDMDFCGEHSERVVVMSQGRVVGDAAAGEILRQMDLLSQARIRAPQLIALATALGMSSAPTTVDGFVAAYGQHRSPRRDTSWSSSSGI